MTSEPTGNTVAVYWDFENLHAALYEREWANSKKYADNRYAPQDALVNVKAVMDYAASIGDVAINRAYNNWQCFFRYREALNYAGIDLIQIYPKGAGAKNGSDIRLALDVLEDVFRYPKLTHVIIVSSDSDFISLAQKLRQSGLTVIGVGVHQATNRYWAQNCDEFRYYDTLLGLMGEAEPAAEQTGEEEGEPAVRPISLADARKLALDALRRLAAEKGTERIPRGSLKTMMKRMDATFDEANLGFLSFGAFLKSFADVIEDIPDDSGGQVRLRGTKKKAGAKGEPKQEAPAATAATEQDYELILKRGNVRLLPSPWWREAVRIVGEIFGGAAHHQLASFDELEAALIVRLKAAGLDADPEMAHKLRGFLFSLRQFDLGKDKQAISLKSQGGVPLLRGVEQEIARRIVRNAAPPVDVSKVAAILYGDDAPHRLAEARKLFESLDA